MDIENVLQFEEFCLNQLVIKLRSYLQNEFIVFLKKQGLLSNDLEKFYGITSDVSVLSSFLLRLLPAEQVVTDSVQEKKSLRDFAKVFCLPLGLRVALVRECSIKVSSWESWSVVEGGLELCNGDMENGKKCSLRLSESAVMLGVQLSTPENADGYYASLESFEVYSRSWGRLPLSVLVYKGNDFVSADCLSEKSFLSQSLLWLKCNELVPRNTNEGKIGHVSKAHFVREMKGCWCLITSPSHLYSEYVPELFDKFGSSTMHFEYVKLTDQVRRSDERHHTMSLVSFLQQGVVEYICQKMTLLLISYSRGRFSYTRIVSTYECIGQSCL